MASFIKDESHPGIAQFTPIPTPIIGRSNSPTSGALWYDTSTNSFQGLVNGVVSAIGGGGNPSSANMLDPTQAPYNVKFDAKSGSDGSGTINQNTFTSTNQNCVTGDIGKLIIVAGSNFYLYGSGVAQYALNTITGCSGNSWTVSANANSTFSNAPWAIGTGNGAGLAASYAAALAAGKILALPCGAGIVESPPFPTPAAINFITQQADIQGCNSTGGTHFILHGAITSGFFATGGVMFAQYTNASATGTIGGPGAGNQTKIENIFIDGLGGPIRGTGSQAFYLINGFNVVNNVVIRDIGLSAGNLTTIAGSGEIHYDRLNIQVFSTLGGTANGVSMTGQGINALTNSIIAFGQNAVLCSSANCSFIGNYFVSMTSGVTNSGAGSFITFVGNQCTALGAAGCLNDGNVATTFYVFGNPLISNTQPSSPAIVITNAGTVLDMSGSNVSSGTAGWNITGAGTVNDRAGNAFSSPLTQFTGKYVPIGGGSVANNNVSAATNFGTNLGATNVLGGISPSGATYDVKIGFRQITLGVGCGAGSNTVNGVLSWTAGGLAQATGSNGIPALNTLTIAANGATGTSSVYSSIPVHIDTNTQVTFTTTSVLASAGCSTTPQYVVDFSNI